MRSKHLLAARSSLYLRAALLFCGLSYPYRAVTQGPSASAHLSPATQRMLVRYVPPRAAKDRLSEMEQDLLRLLLEKTKKTHGDFRLQAALPLAQGRALEFLRQGKEVDVVATMTSRERERDLIPIRVCLMKGLIGVRLLLVRKEELGRFASLKTADELKKLLTGQGHDWPDTQILRANGFRLITSPTYTSLFEMLQRKRFDMFPRSVAEIWSEAENYKKNGLVVEPTIALTYPTGYYFFVSKKNPALATRLGKGFELAIKDGSFDAFFKRYNNENLKKANLNARKKFQLNNPFLPKETPLDRAELWHEFTRTKKPRTD